MRKPFLLNKPHHNKIIFGVSNTGVQQFLQNMARGEKKGADQMLDHRTADLHLCFRICKGHMHTTQACLCIIAVCSVSLLFAS